MPSTTEGKGVEDLIREEISIVRYHPVWPKLFAQEKEQLRSLIPVGLLGRIEHFGSTAVRGCREDRWRLMARFFGLTSWG